MSKTANHKETITYSTVGELDVNVMTELSIWYSNDIKMMTEERK